MVRSLAFCAVFACLASAASETVSADGAIILTVTGAITESNRGAMQPLEDSFLNANEIEFDAAYEFDLEALNALAQSSATARGYNWPAPATVTGPTLEAVLQAVGAAPDATLYATALDGYQAEITAEDRSEMTWVLGAYRGGRPLSIGGKGPLWLLPDRGADPAPQGGGSKWVWSVYHISVE